MNSEVSSPPDAGKWERWRGVLGDAADMPSKKTLARTVTVPIVTAIATAVLLLVLNPPFVCAGRNQTTSAAKITVWAVVAGLLTALFSAQGMFARFSKSC